MTTTPAVLDRPTTDRPVDEDEPYELLCRSGRLLAAASGSLSDGVTFRATRRGLATCVHLHDEHVVAVRPPVPMRRGDELEIQIDFDPSEAGL